MLFMLSFFMAENRIAHSSRENLFAAMQAKEVREYTKAKVLHSNGRIRTGDYHQQLKLFKKQTDCRGQIHRCS